ncbi:MAG: hypothetical protein U0V72_06625 [Cytophagales bacterium]
MKHFLTFCLLFMLGINNISSQEILRIGNVNSLTQNNSFSSDESNLYFIQDKSILSHSLHKENNLETFYSNTDTIENFILLKDFLIVSEGKGLNKTISVVNKSSKTAKSITKIDSSEILIFCNHYNDSLLILTENITKHTYKIYKGSVFKNSILLKQTFNSLVSNDIYRTKIFLSDSNIYIIKLFNLNSEIYNYNFIKGTFGKAQTNFKPKVELHQKTLFVYNTENGDLFTTKDTLLSLTTNYKTNNSIYENIKLYSLNDSLVLEEFILNFSFSPFVGTGKISKIYNLATKQFENKYSFSTNNSPYQTFDLDKSIFMIYRENSTHGGNSSYTSRFLNYTPINGYYSTSIPSATQDIIIEAGLSTDNKLVIFNNKINQEANSTLQIRVFNCLNNSFNDVVFPYQTTIMNPKYLHGNHETSFFSINNELFEISNIILSSQDFNTKKDFNYFISEQTINFNLEQTGKILDINGQCLSTFNNQKSISIHDFKSGVYIIYLKDRTLKFIK